MVRLKVKDDDGLFDTAERKIMILGIFPPIDLTLTREINQSLFKKKTFHTLTWSFNPSNTGLTIVNYRIYRKQAGQGDQDYKLIGTVSGDIFEYMDEYLEIYKKFVYAVTAVESSGHESKLSSPVGN